MLDPTLEMRLSIHSQDSNMPSGVIDATKRVLTHLNRAFTITDETAGVFTSHLVEALSRVLHGQPVDEPPASVFKQVLEERPTCWDHATTVCKHLEAQLDTHLPLAEKQFIAIHLAALTPLDSKETS